MNKRAIAILGAIFILIVATLGVLIFLRSRSKDKPAAEEQPQEQTYATPQEDPVPEEPVSAGLAVKLSDEHVLSPTLFFQGDGIAYFDSQGQLYNASLEKGASGYTMGNLRQITLPVRTGVGKVVWPATGNNFLVESKSASGSRAWSVFNSVTNSYVDLPSNITTIDWLPDGETLVYIWLDSQGKSTLNVANTDNTSYQDVAEIWENDDEISVSPDGQSILFYRRDSKEAKNQINLTTPDGSLFRGIVLEGYNSGVLWAPDNRHFLFGRRNASGSYELWLGDITLGAVRGLGIITTTEKVVWSKDSQTIYAAVPKANSSSLGLSEDQAVRINTETLEQKQYDLGSGIDARDLFLSLTDDALFFKNAQDSTLYYLDLTK